MVRTSSALCKFIPEWYKVSKTSSNYFKKQALFYMTRYYKNIGWSTRKNALNRYDYFLKGEMWNRERNSQLAMDGNRMRVAAACEEHDFNYPHLVSSLKKLDINLQMAMLARLTIYEPQTFKTLVEICREANSDD